MRVQRPLHNVFYAAMLCAAVLLVVPRVASAQAELLQNPGFEGVYTPFSNDNTRMVAPGWTPWNVAANPGEPSHVNNQPTYRSTVDRIHGGSVSQEFYTFYATHTGGLYQQVPVAKGTKLQFSAWLNVWSTANDDPTRSEIPGQVKLQVGIDPAGGTDATAAGVTWSAPVEFYDQWRELSIIATSTSDTTVTVFIRSAPAMPVHHNHVFVDDASLRVAPDTTATPEPSATPTGASVVTATPPEIPSPTREGTVPPTEGVTLVPPTATPSETPIPPTVEPPTLTPTPVPPSATSTLGPPSVVPSTLTPSQIVPTVPFTPTPVVTGTPFSSEFPYTIKYTVQYGNTLSDIAVMYDSSVDAIVKVNGIEDAGLIYVGQVLDIPTRTPPRPTPVPIPPTAPYPPNLTGPTNGGIGTYIVQPGDDLSKIASLYRTTPWALAKLNGILNPNLIRIGQVLVVPGPGNNVGPGGGVPPPPQPPPMQRTHVIRFGETLYSISIHYGVPLDALMRINGIINPSLIYVGQVLRIP